MIDSPTTGAMTGAPNPAATPDAAGMPSATVAVTASTPLVLRVQSGRHVDRKVRVRGDRLLIGTGEQCGLRLRLPGLTEVECTIVLQNGRWMAKAGSPRIRWNGENFQQVPLAQGDRLSLGSVELTVLEPLPQAIPAPAAAEPAPAETPSSTASDPFPAASSLPEMAPPTEDATPFLAASAAASEESPVAEVAEGPAAETPAEDPQEPEPAIQETSISDPPEAEAPSDDPAMQSVAMEPPRAETAEPTFEPAAAESDDNAVDESAVLRAEKTIAETAHAPVAEMPRVAEVEDAFETAETVSPEAAPEVEHVARNELEAESNADPARAETDETESPEADQPCESPATAIITSSPVASPVVNVVMNGPTAEASAHWGVLLEGLSQSCLDLKSEQQLLSEACRTQSELVQELAVQWHSADQRYAAERNAQLQEIETYRDTHAATIARMDALAEQLSALRTAEVQKTAADAELSQWRAALQQQLSQQTEQAGALHDLLTQLRDDCQEGRDREAEVENRLATLTELVKSQSEAMNTLRDELGALAPIEPSPDEALPHEYRDLITESLDDVRQQLSEAHQQRQEMAAAFAEWQTQLTARSEELERRLVELRTEQADFIEERQRWQTERRKAEANLLMRSEARTAEVERSELRLAEIRAERESLELERRHQAAERAEFRDLPGRSGGSVYGAGEVPLAAAHRFFPSTNLSPARDATDRIPDDQPSVSDEAPARTDAEELESNIEASPEPSVAQDPASTAEDDSADAFDIAERNAILARYGLLKGDDAAEANDATTIAETTAPSVDDAETWTHAEASQASAYAEPTWTSSYMASEESATEEDESESAEAQDDDAEARRQEVQRETTSYDVDEAEAPLEREPATSPAIREPKSGEEEHENSIEEYMQRLLQRVRTLSTSPEKSGTDAPANAKTTSAPAAEPAVVKESQPIEAPAPAGKASLADMRPRAAAPERNSDMLAMRSLAQQNARKALDTHDKSVLQRKIRTKLVVTIVALCCSFALMFFLGRGMFSYLGALLCLGVAGYSGFRYLAMSSRAMTLGDEEAPPSPPQS